MRSVFTTSTLLALSLQPRSALADQRFAVEAFLGAAHNFATDLTVEQSGHQDIELTAEYSTRPLDFPVYYALRLDIFDEHGAWELQFIHHKLHLENRPETIGNFEITHGFNLLTLGRSWALPVDIRVAGGVVIAHPESEVRGRASSLGYQLTGPAIVIGGGKRWDLTSRLFVTGDVQLVVARARVAIHGGEASTSNLSLHALFGMGTRF